MGQGMSVPRRLDHPADGDYKGGVMNPQSWKVMELHRGVGAVLGIALAAGPMLPARAAAPKKQVPVPKTFLIDGTALAKARMDGDAEMIRLAKIQGDRAMQDGPVSVMDKKAVPPSGDKHDYMSLAPYFWPNPATKDHLPYIRKDGQHNPEASAIPDHENFTRMAEDVHAWALAYFLADDDKYAKHAAESLRVWFLAPATRMNPNLKYAQAVLGVNDGRGTGVLESRCLTDVVDALALLAGSSDWTAKDEAGMHEWIDAYFTWLTSSANGKAEHDAKNNHGSWDDVQEASLALYLGKTDFVKDLVETAKTKRIGLQIQADGQQPMEEERTKSFGYCVFNVDALMQLATLGDEVGVDLWGYTSPAGGSIRKALDYLIPFAADPKAWGHENIAGMTPDALRAPLLMAAVHYRSVAYKEDALHIRAKDDPLQTLLVLEFMPLPAGSKGL